jgi:hypothetical protein
MLWLLYTALRYKERQLVNIRIWFFFYKSKDFVTNTTQACGWVAWAYF